MAFSEFIESLRALHLRAGKGELDLSGQGEYDRDRDELAQALMTAQNLTVKPGERPRQALRVAKAVQLTLDLPRASLKTMTTEISARSFSALVPEPPEPGRPVPFSLRMPGGEALTGTAIPVDVKRQAHSSRVGFSLKDLSVRDLLRLETLVFDEVLSKFGKR